MMIETLLLKRTGTTYDVFASAHRGTLTNFVSGQVKIKFNGTAFKLLFRTYSSRTEDGTIIVDGVTYSGINMKTPGEDVQIVKFEMDNLLDGDHEIIIMKTLGASGDMMFDAVDIKGILLNAN